MGYYTAILTIVSTICRAVQPEAAAETAQPFYVLLLEAKDSMSLR